MFGDSFTPVAILPVDITDPDELERLEVFPDPEGYVDEDQDAPTNSTMEYDDGYEPDFDYDPF